MAFVTQVGALSFSLESATRGRLPELPARPLWSGDGFDLQVVEEDGRSYLLVDHRADTSAPARVEFWRPVEVPEVPLAGLFMMTETALPGPAPAYERLGDLANALGC